MVDGETSQTIDVDSSGMYSVTVGDSSGVANNHSLSFDGVDDVELSNFNLDNKSFTIAIDFKSPQNNSYETILRNTFISGSDYNGFYLRFENNGEIHFDVNNVGLPQQYPAGGNILLLNSGGSYSDDLWHNVCITYDQFSSQAFMTIDGIPVDSQIVPVAITSSFNNNSLYLGENGFAGTLDNLSFWNRPLSQSEINNIWPAHQQAMKQD